MHKKNESHLTTILIIVGFLLFILNKEFLRPKYGSLPVIGIVLGSLPNFLGAFCYSVIAIEFLPMKRRYSGREAGLITFVIFIILTVEEFYPFLTATKTFDYYDILASGLGSILVVFYYEWLNNKKNCSPNIN
ncbi:hypothetical protein [Galbibacter sp. BG1]